MDREDEKVTLCELIADSLLAGGSIEEWPSFIEEMLGEIDEMIWGAA